MKKYFLELTGVPFAWSVAILKDGKRVTKDMLPGIEETEVTHVNTHGVVLFYDNGVATRILGNYGFTQVQNKDEL